MLIALSIQLALYAVTWSLMGSAFGIERTTVRSWSAAWALMAIATATLSFEMLPPLHWSRSAMNTMLVTSFALLAVGTAKVTQIPVSRGSLGAPIALAVSIDLLRYVWFVETAAFRWIAFAVCLGWLVFLVAVRLMKALQRIGFARLSVLIWGPALIVAAFFWLRVYWFFSTEDPIGNTFSGTGKSEQWAIALFFAALGAFNLALAAFVVGRMVRRLRELSDTDQLTQLSNRRSMLRQIALEDARFRRTGRGYSILMFDLDHFKRINDTYGHPGGDVVLMEVAKVMREEIRSNDVAGRHGGEEFMLLMPETDPGQAHALGARIHRRIGDLSMELNGLRISVTASAGIATAATADADFYDVIKRADATLYRAKETGRNRVEVA